MEKLDTVKGVSKTGVFYVTFHKITGGKITCSLEVIMVLTDFFLFHIFNRSFFFLTFYWGFISATSLKYLNFSYISRNTKILRVCAKELP